MHSKSVSSELFSFFPREDVSHGLAIRYRLRLLESLREIAVKVFQARKLSAAALMQKLAVLSHHRLSTEIYALNYFLIRALKEERNVASVCSLLDELSGAPIERYIHMDLIVCNLGSQTWTLDFAKSTVSDANQINGDAFASMEPVDEGRMAVERSQVSEAIAYLKQGALRPLFDELSHYVAHIVLFDGKGITGGSSSRNIGAIYIRVPGTVKPPRQSVSLDWLPPVLYYLEQVIHETAHLHLDMLMEFDPLVENSADCVYESPIREDPRPMRGVFHATFVLARLAWAFGQIQSHPMQVLVDLRVKVLKEALAKGLNTVSAHGQLTTLGRQILKDMESVHAGST